MTSPSRPTSMTDFPLPDRQLRAGSGANFNKKEKQMDKIKIEREALVMSDTERKRLVHILQYVRHRLTQHPECGIKEEVTFVDYMIGSLK